MAELSVPDKPRVVSVTHHTVQLEWEEALNSAGNLEYSGDDRFRVTLQQEYKKGSWSNIYTGYDKRHSVENLKPATLYSFRLRLHSDEEESPWSPAVQVTTKKEPLNGVHLHRAVQMRNLMGVERIIQTGDVSVEVTDRHGFTPLMQAAVNGHLDILELLLENGAEVDAQNYAGKTALMLAAFAGKLTSMQALRENSANTELRDKGGSTALHWAVDGQDIECVQWCLEDGWDVDVRNTSCNWTPLLRCAAVNGNKDVAKMLIKYGADVNTIDLDGKTALMIAVINGHHDLVDVLLKSSADICVKNQFGKNVIEMAYSMENRRILKLLAKYIPDMDYCIRS